jgi:hypothetical protein
MEAKEIRETIQGTCFYFTPANYEAFRNMKPDEQLEAVRAMTKDDTIAQISLRVQNTPESFILLKTFTAADLR